MRLLSAHVTKFKSATDSAEFALSVVPAPPGWQVHAHQFGPYQPNDRGESTLQAHCSSRLTITGPTGNQAE
jgi:hypothetical protein